MTQKCPQCGATYSDDFRFCNDDGTPLVPQSTASESKQPIIAGGNRWGRRPGEFAAHIHASDLSAYLSKGLIVEEGTQGLLFQNGRMAGTLGPGRHTIEGVTQRLKNLVFSAPTSVVLIDTSHATVPVVTPGMHTQDGKLVEGETHVVLAVNHPIDFYLHVMKGQKVMLTQDLADRIRPWIVDAIEPIVAGSAASELSGNPEFRERVELDLRQVLRDRLARLGLVLVGVDQARYVSPDDAAVMQRRRELNRDQALAEVDQSFDQFRDRLAGESAKRKMAQVQSDAEMSQFLKQQEHDLFRKDLVRQNDRDDLSRQFLERREDQQSGRVHLLAQLELKRKEELARVRHDFDMADATRQHEAALKRLNSQGEVDTEALRQQQVKLDAELKGRLVRSQQEFEARLAQDRASFDWDLHTRAARERLDIELEKERQALKLQNARDGIELYNEYKSGKQKREQEDHRLKFELDQQAAANQHAHDMDRASKYQELGVEALIAMAPVEQAGLLADLRKTETLKDMSESQIMALFAKDSPEIARALAEQFKSAGSQQAEATKNAEQLYERMLADKDNMLQAFKQMHESVMGSQQQLAEKALEVQRDTATAAASPQQHVHVNNPAPSRPTPRSNVASACPSCQAAVPAASYFCQSCGRPI